MSDDTSKNEEGSAEASADVAGEPVAAGDSLLDPNEGWQGEPTVEAKPETKPEEEGSKARDKRQADVERALDRSMYAALVAVAVWYLLNAFVIRQTFNPHFPDPDRHEWSNSEGKYYTDDWDFSQPGDGRIDKWRDPKTRKVYTWKHAKVKSGGRIEKAARGTLTFLCGLPIVAFFFRCRKYDGDENKLRRIVAFGLFWCFAAALAAAFTGIVDWMVDAISTLAFCGVMILPFYLWPKRHLLFGKKKADRTED